MTMYQVTTPWGIADHVEYIAEGIYSVSTPSHGGIMLDHDRADMIPDDIEPFSGDRRFWEEDSDWCVPYLVFRADMAHWSAVKNNGPEAMAQYAIDAATAPHNTDKRAVLAKHLEG
jgi:hypothetical protein